MNHRTSLPIRHTGLAIARTLRRLLLLLTCVLVAANISILLPAPAHADTVGGNRTGFTRIAGGVFELGLDNLLLVNFEQTTQAGVGPAGEDVDVSSLDASWVGGLTPRYFLFDNFCLALPIYGFLGKKSATTTIGDQEDTTESTDVGVLGFLMANYYLRLGNSFFFKPGIGIGGFYGSRSIPVDGTTDQKQSLALSGLAARLDLGFVFYAGEHFNLKAGVDVVPRFGTIKAEDSEDGQGFTSIDAGFNVGLAYSF